MAVWDELRVVLARLLDEQPGVLMLYPMPEADEAVVVDPRTGEVTGGFSGPEHRPLIMFRVPPGQTGRIPLLIGTASYTPRLGYTIPPGDWGLYATLALGPPTRDSPLRRTPILPLTITA
jgi:hypothetical protein